MNTSVDKLLAMIIEDLIPLTENIERLHRMGYINHFDVSGEQVVCLESRLCVPISDVIIDEILEYSDKRGALDPICLFAIHELKYHRKGIYTAHGYCTPLNDVSRT